MTNRTLSLLIINLLTLNLTAQDLGNDITIKFSQSFLKSNESRIGLEYRKTLGESFKLKLGSDFGRSNKDVWIGNNVLFGSDSVAVTRDLASFSTTYSLYAGADYEGIDFISIGASLILGTNNVLLAAFDRGARYNPESKKWENCIECAYTYHGQEPSQSDNASLPEWQYGSAIKTSKYVVYGISLRAAIRIPIRNRFEVTTRYEPYFVRNKRFEEVEYQALDDTYSFKSSAFNSFAHSFTAAVRYKF